MLSLTSWAAHESPAGSGGGKAAIAEHDAQREFPVLTGNLPRTATCADAGDDMPQEDAKRHSRGRFRMVSTLSSFLSRAAICCWLASCC